MKRKTIKAVLTKKITDWINSIEDVELKKLIKRDAIVTGGSIVSLLMNESPNDYDVYFKTQDTVKKVAEYYVNKFNEKNGAITNKCGHSHKAFVLDGRLPLDEQLKETDSKFDWKSEMLAVDEDRIKIIVRSDGIAEDGQKRKEEVASASGITRDQLDVMLDEADGLELIDDSSDEQPKDKYRPLFLSSNAITLSDKIQIVIRFWGDPEKIHENYDFEHCKNWWTFKELYLHQPALECILNKDLVYTGSKYPVCSLVRMRKFIKRGWNINAGQIVKMALQISELDLLDTAILEDQLVGVDTVYFLCLVNSIREHQKKNEDFKLDIDYISSVIDKIFGV